MKPDLFNFETLISQVESINIEYALSIISNSISLYEKTLRQFNRSLMQHINKMDTYIKQHDLALFAGEMHYLKGSLNQAGCLEYADLAKSLEKSAKLKDDLYCVKYYDSFKEKLLILYDQLNEIFIKIETNTESEEIRIGNINDFTNVLIQAKSAADNYDNILAVEILSALKNYNFGEDADRLLSKTMDALEAFQPNKAFEYLSELLEDIT